MVHAIGRHGNSARACARRRGDRGAGALRQPRDPDSRRADAGHGARDPFPDQQAPGCDGTDAYERNHRELLRSKAHLLEIDLLRRGQRPALVSPDLDAPYMLLLSRVERRPEVEIWPLNLRTSIPPMPVPLQAPDPDVALDIQTALLYVYRSARYDLRIDYGVPPPPPDLPSEDAAWLDQHLRRQGVRV